MIATAFARVTHCLVGSHDLAYTLLCRQCGITVFIPADTMVILPGSTTASSLTHKSRQTDQIVFLSGSRVGSFAIMSIVFFISCWSISMI